MGGVEWGEVGRMGQGGVGRGGVGESEPLEHVYVFRVCVCALVYTVVSEGEGTELIGGLTKHAVWEKQYKCSVGACGWMNSCGTNVRTCTVCMVHKFHTVNVCTYVGVVVSSSLACVYIPCAYVYTVYSGS